MSKKTTKKTPLDQLDAPLAKVVKLLQKRAMTATALAAKLDTTKPTAYARLARLKAHGYVFKTEKVREGSVGPEATSYRIGR